MKMRLNGKPFTIYVTDSVSTIEDRIASRFNSLPKWLIFVSPTVPLKSVKDFVDANDVKVVDFLHASVLNQTTLTVPTNFPPTVTMEQVQDLFVGTNATLTETDDRARQTMLYSIKNLHRDADSIWRDRTRTLGLLNREIAANRDRVARLERMAIEFEAIEPMPFTRYEVDHVQFTLNLGKFDHDLLFLFDALVTSRNVPYASVASDGKLLYKVHNGFEIDPGWLNIELTDVLFLKVNSELDRAKPQHVYRSYTNAAFAIQDGDLLATMDLNVGTKFVDRQNFIIRVLDSFRTLWHVASERDNQIVVYYSIPNQCIDAVIFAELAMNDPSFSALIALDEFMRPSKVSSAIYVYRLGSIATVSMVLKQTRKQNEYGMANVGEWYVRCRLRAESTDDIEPLQIVMGKLMTLYNLNQQRVISVYTHLIPSFKPQTCAAKPLPRRAFTAKGLRAIAPEIFYPRYSRRCANPPVIVSADMQVGDADSMDFPIKGEMVDGQVVETRTYACVEKSHPFIGLRKNDLENSETFPAIPCCFRRNQKQRSGSLYRNYYFDEAEETVARQIQQTEAYKRRILDPDETETLPENLVRLFNSLEPDPTVQYVRRGVTKTRLASIEAILLGKGQIVYKRMRKSTIANRVIRDAIRLDSEAYAMAAKQELFDMDVEEIRDMMRTVDLRPSKFVHALETLMDCNIFIFVATDDEPKGRLLVPDHAAFYSKYRPNRETFFLFEHYGADSATYPAVELIVRTDGNSFLPGDPIVKRVFALFVRLTRSFLTTTPILVPKFPRFRVVSQLVDSNGKCRLINVDEDGTEFSIVTDPLPPFAAPQTQHVARFPTNDSIVRFVDKWKLSIEWQRPNEIGVMIGNVKCILLVRNGVTLPNVRIVASGIRSPFDDLDLPNALETFDATKRASSVLLQYALKAAAQLGPIDKRNVNAELVRLPITIDPTVSYKIESDRFDSNPSFQTPSGAIIVPSDSVRKRLLFAVRMRVLYNPNQVSALKNRQTIDDFFSNVRDFIDTPATIILDGKESVLNMIQTFASAEKRIFSSVNPLTKRPYFFKNNLISSDEIFLAIPVDSLDDANANVIAWTTHGYYDRALIAPTPFRPAVFGIVNANEIEPISASDGAYDGCVLGYKKSRPPGRRGHKRSLAAPESSQFAFVALLKI